MQIENNILKTDEKIAFLLRSLYHRFGYNHYKMKKFETYHSTMARERNGITCCQIFGSTNPSKFRIFRKLLLG